MFCIANKYKCQVHNKYQYTQNDNLDPNSMLLWFWVQFQIGAFEHHKHWFGSNDLSCYVGGFMRKFAIVRSQVSIVWLVQHGVNYHVQKKLGFSLSSNVRITLKISLFRGEAFIVSNCQVPFFCTQNFVKLVNASN